MLPNLGQTATGQQGLGTSEAGYYTPSWGNNATYQGNPQWGQYNNLYNNALSGNGGGQGGYAVPSGLPTLPTFGPLASGYVLNPNANVSGRNLQANPNDTYAIPANAWKPTPNAPTQNKLGVSGAAGVGNANPSNPTGNPAASTGYAKAHAELDGKLGAGWAENFQKAHGQSPVDFYTDHRNWFPAQAAAAKDFGLNSDQFRAATIQATVQEGLMHQQEASTWEQLHGNTPIPDEMWQRWYAVNRGYANVDQNGKLPDGNPVVY